MQAYNSVVLVSSGTTEGRQPPFRRADQSVRPVASRQNDDTGAILTSSGLAIPNAV